MISSRWIGFGKAKAETGWWGLTFTALDDNATISMSKGTGASTPNLDLLYSTDAGQTWAQFVPGTTQITLQHVGDQAYIKAGPNGNVRTAGSTAATNVNAFVITGGRIAASGDVTSLLDGSRSVKDLTDRPYTFIRLFQDCTSLVTPPEIPCTVATNYSFTRMFQGCTSLTSVAQLSFTSLAAGSSACSYMYSGCSSIQDASNLNIPAVGTIANTGQMFGYMFQGCTSLVNPPIIPAFVSRTQYRNMFQNCTSLVNAPDLMATEVTTGCYMYMFYGCTSLNRIKVGFTDWSFAATQSPTADWTQNVAENGTFICPAALADMRGYTAIPTNWTRQDL